MPKVGMEPIRKDALVKATIYEISQAGSLDVTVSKIAKRAGISSALAHHYFGSKDNILIAAMRHILTLFDAEVRGAMTMAKTPRERVEAIICASFSSRNFRGDVISAWLNFYGLAHVSNDAYRLLKVYQNRLQSNLTYELKAMTKGDASEIAMGIAAMIDGFYIRRVFQEVSLDSETCVKIILDYLDATIEKNVRSEGENEYTT